MPRMMSMPLLTSSPVTPLRSRFTHLLPCLIVPSGHACGFFTLSGCLRTGGGGVTHAPPTSVMPSGHLQEPGVGPGCIGAGHAQMPSTLGTCGAVQTGGVGTQAPPTSTWPCGQTGGGSTQTPFTITLGNGQMH